MKSCLEKCLRKSAMLAGAALGIVLTPVFVRMLVCNEGATNIQRDTVGQLNQWLHNFYGIFRKPVVASTSLRCSAT